MNLRLLASCGVFCAAVVLAGCDSGRQAPGRVNVRIANAAPGYTGLTFMRERDTRNASNLLFRGSAESVYDADTYDFTVFTEGSEQQVRTWTFQSTLELNNLYTFVLTEVAGEVREVVLQNAAAPASEAQVNALHAGGGLPAMDLYLQAPGVGIAGATPFGTFNALEQIAPRTLPGGDYELWLTAAGNPANVLLASAAINLPVGVTSTFIAVPEAGYGTAQLSVMLLQGTTGGILYDRNATSELRVINAANDRLPRDFAVDSQFSPPLFSAMPFGELTPYAPVPTVATTINVTPVGDPGALEINQSYAGTVGQRATMLFNGPAGTLVPTFSADDGRRIHGVAKMRFMNAATQFIGIDFVITAPDADPNLAPAVGQVFPPGISLAYTLVEPGEYDLYLYQYATLNVLSGPTRISVAEGGIYSVLAVDGADTATANALLLDDFP
jgi:hypothetical protein